MPHQVKLPKSDLVETAEKIGKLSEAKNRAYGCSFGKIPKILEVLYPNGIPVEHYKNMLYIARVLDKIFRIANDKDAFGEDPFQDIAGYSILGVVLNKEKK